jgi:exodeoxyribonuclease VII small subunit
MAKRQQETPAFEKSLQELEALVAKMEQGNLSLEESLQYFERGIQLTRTCQQALKAAEQKVEILLKKTGQDNVAPFSSDDA